MKKLMAVMASLLMAATFVCGQDFGTAVFNHRIAIGMTFGNVLAAWGKPTQVNRSISSGGGVEWWWYNSNNGVTMVEFEGGRVVYIGQ